MASFQTVKKWTFWQASDFYERNVVLDDFFCTGLVRNMARWKVEMARWRNGFFIAKAIEKIIVQGFGKEL